VLNIAVFILILCSKTWIIVLALEDGGASYSPLFSKKDTLWELNVSIVFPSYLAFEEFREHVITDDEAPIPSNVDTVPTLPLPIKIPAP
jgi:hypothetical protein